MAGFYQSRHGYQYNLFDDSRVGGFKRNDERVSLTIKPFDGVKNDLVVEHSNYRGSSTQAVLYNFGLPYNPANPGAALPGAPLPIATLYGPRGDPALAQGVALQPGQEDIVSQIQDQRARGPYIVDAGGPNYYRPKSLILTNTTTIDIAKDIQFKNIFGYGHFSNHLGLDLVGTSLIIDNENETSFAHQFSDEAQVLGKALDGDLTYVTGVFYSDEHLHNTLLSDIAPALGLARQDNNYSKTDRTAAVYGQATYSLTRITGIAGLGVTVGLRYTDERVSNAILPGDISYTSANLANPAFDFNQSQTSKNLGWTIGIQEQLNSQVLLYGVTRRSFKNAGFNGLNTPIIGIAGENGGNGYLTEMLTDGELGAKFSGRLAGIPTRLNADVYIDEIKNAQHVAYTIGAGGAPAAITVNVPHARSVGFEIDGQTNPVPWLTVGGSVNYIDAKFDDNLVGNVAFGPVPDSPRWSGTGFATVTLPLNGDMDLFFGGNVYMQSSFYITSTGITNRGGRLPGYNVTNFQIGIEDHKRGLSLTANIKNAFDRVYYVGGLAPAELFNFNSAVPGDPRTFLIEARIKF